MGLTKVGDAGVNDGPGDVRDDPQGSRRPGRAWAMPAIGVGLLILVLSAGGDFRSTAVLIGQSLLLAGLISVLGR